MTLLAFSGAKIRNKTYRYFVPSKRDEEQIQISKDKRGKVTRLKFCAKRRRK